jgi:hypothetical protein
MIPQRIFENSILILGIVLALVFHPLDYYFARSNVFVLLLTRLSEAIFLLTLMVIVNRCRDNWVGRVMLIGYVGSSLFTSLLTFLTGGYLSYYYPGSVIIIIFAAIYFKNYKYFIIAVVANLILYFTILSFGPKEFKYILMDAIFLGTYSISGGIIHYLSCKSYKEIKILKGFLPICAKCKKIRNDKGYWNQIEKYITERSEVEFTHSLCPDCAEIIRSEYQLQSLQSD